jgi:hypothetical protein
LYDVSHSGVSGRVEAEMIREIGDFPGARREFGECPSLAEVGKAARILEDVVAGRRGVGVQVSLQAAELIQDVVDLAIDGRDVLGLGWLLAGA